MKIAAIQMVSGATLRANLDAAAALLAQAAREGAELAVLPEYFGVMGLNERDKLKLQETAGRGAVQDFLSQTARWLGLWIVGGTLPIATADTSRARNTSLAYAPSGQCVARYDKIHLFRFAQGEEEYDETRVLEPGAEPVRFELASRDGHIYTIGMSVCYDLRFPELYRALKADLLLVPSAFTYTTGQAHWEVLLRARAIENLAYVLAAAQGGTHENGRRTWGHSMLVDPWGRVLAEQAEGPGVVMGEVVGMRQQEMRQRLPALSHRVL
ncbi:MAG: carbon-nitrogen hydrolase family protein [Pseudomonadota bacterium]|nr:carbon-nitrogen hydrolase family protein [Pseudomonadota bacterium]